MKEAVDKISPLAPRWIKAYTKHGLYRWLPYPWGQWLHRRICHQKYKFLMSVRRDDFRSGYMFVHVPRTAGVSLHQTLFPDHEIEVSHIPAWDFRLVLDENTYRSLFKFAFVRNPWDRLLSAFRFMKDGGYGPDDSRWATAHLDGIHEFNEFVTEWLAPERLATRPHWLPQVHWLTDPVGNLEVDFVGRFESLQEDFQRLCDHIGMTAELPHINRSDRKTETYRDVYSNAAAEKVCELYQEDIDLFGYTF